MADYVPMMTAALAAAGVYGALDGTGARQGAGGGVSSASRPAMPCDPRFVAWVPRFPHACATPP